MGEFHLKMHIDLARTLPTTFFFGREVRSGLDPLRSNYDQTRNVRANQIARAGFIR